MKWLFLIIHSHREMLIKEIHLTVIINNSIENCPSIKLRQLFIKLFLKLSTDELYKSNYT